jgi:hypothetical protein
VELEAVEWVVLRILVLVFMKGRENRINSAFGKVSHPPASAK